MTVADTFVKKCRESGYELPENTDLSIPGLAQLVATNENLLFPSLFANCQLALPIATEWIQGPLNKNTVFVLVSMLTSRVPAVSPLCRVFLESSPRLDYSDPSVLMGIVRLLSADFGSFARYFSCAKLNEAVNATASDKPTQTLALVALSLLSEVSESVLDQWLQATVNCDSTHFEFTTIVNETVSKSVWVSNASTFKNEQDPFKVEYQNPMLAKVADVYLPRLSSEQGNVVEFIETETSQLNLHLFAKALQLASPILLVGESGSGKTKLVEYIHSSVRGGDLVRIHLGDQTDAKGLVGAYTSGATPGSFEWKYGALASAVQLGKWVLIEDIDKSPSEVASLLLPLLDRGELVLPSRNQVIAAAPGFQIIATSTSKEQNLRNIIGARLWNAVQVLSPPDGDLEIFVEKSMSTARKDRQKLAVLLVQTFYAVRDHQQSHKYARLVSVKDLLKLARRIQPLYNADDVFLECVSVFASFSINKNELAVIIAESLGAAWSRCQILLSRRDPQVSVTDADLVIGRANIARRAMMTAAAQKFDANANSAKFALTIPAKQLLEEIAVAVMHHEPVLLVGESGTGKTAIVQHLAALVRRKLVVVNVSQQVESGDLIGGFKPMDAKQLLKPLLDIFYDLFDSTFSRAKNHEFVTVLDKAIAKEKYSAVVKLLKEAVKLVYQKTRKESQTKDSKNKRPRVDTSAQNISEWTKFSCLVEEFETKLKTIGLAPQFQFVSGLLVKAAEQGHWILLDELNLAPADTIEGIGELISSRSLTLLDAGGEVVKAHPNFRIFANMNPATDVGKRDLPAGVRSLFTEIWSSEPDKDLDALRAIVATYLPLGTPESIIDHCSNLFVQSRELAAKHEIADGAGQKPHFSMRNLSRMLVATCAFSSSLGFVRAIFEAFEMCFVTPLDTDSALKLSNVAKEILKLPLTPAKAPKSKNALITYDSDNAGVQIGQFKLKCGQHPVVADSKYIITPTVEHHLKALTRAASLRSFPILLQGPTSSGKTSMVTYLASISGHRVVRVNNHEHTDLAEYMGSYESDQNGTLVFKEGALVQALRNGDWLILDELNLAPSDVLEALNRLLDDNRELLVPETQEYVRPHPDFLLFATQNPADGTYAGRKSLSRAFRSRFLELHFGDIPESELDVILRDRTLIAPSYAKKIVEVYQNLSRAKSSARIFEHPATLRDLFRWASRIAHSGASSYDDVASSGFALLGERARSDSERELVRQVLESTLRAEISIDNIKPNETMELVMANAPKSIVWTNSMKRVLHLTLSCLDQNEPTLLVGETGCGKTTVVQALAAALNVELITVNAHQNTETSDLVGSQRPVRVSELEDGSKRLFEWVNGPLVKAMQTGSIFLLDEISLADDSVLERLNSVLESGRTLFVPEVGTIVAAPGFKFIATMNPGGDYGKKELSPALRNRFTEIWVPPALDRDDLMMAVNRILPSFEAGVTLIVDFSVHMYKTNKDPKIEISLRDVVSWANFVHSTELTLEMVLQGAFMVFIDRVQNAKEKKSLIKYLTKLAGESVQTDDIPIAVSEAEISAGPFSIPRRQVHDSKVPFSLEAPTTASNAMRVLRALQVSKPVLLEGPPGAGKTSLVTALAETAGVHLARINMSEQTDLADLFGQDAPLTEPGKFAWRTAPFLRAMLEGEWVLLDEMNLAPQQVLEGLNACLDHRGEAYIPELDRSFLKHPNFKVFAAQNSQAQGGGRKGLPKSFLSRFTCVYVEQLNEKDLNLISAHTHPTVPYAIRSRIANYIERLGLWANNSVLLGQPFEFNLRDTLRWLDLLEQNQDAPVSRYFSLIVLQRFRTPKDRQHAVDLFYEYFPEELKSQAPELPFPVDLTPQTFRMNDINCTRGQQVHVHNSIGKNITLLASEQPVLENILLCIQKAWPVLLVGSSGSGKTSMIRLLAMLCGARLHEFAVTADLDSGDLLGEFDQLDKDAEWFKMWRLIERSVSKHPLLTNSELLDAIRAKDLTQLQMLLPETHYAYSEVSQAVNAFSSLRFDKPSFTWVDGMLVTAIECGDWLVLDNANLCAPSVLDRLNSLLERDGKLFISECADADGNPRVITPHPNFRLFLTSDPSNGELSRAMRNRSVEIWTSDLNTEVPKVTKQLDLMFSKPLTVSRLLSLTSRSWLSAIVVNDETANNIALSDYFEPEFCSFLSSKAHEIKQLYVNWCLWQYNRQLQQLMEKVKALTKRPAENLLELSIYAKFRPSTACEFDLYAVVQAVLKLVELGFVELGPLLHELFTVTDLSRVLVFRDHFVDFAEKNGLSEFSELVWSALGNDDRTKGALLKPIWEHFGRPNGFENFEMYSKHAEVQNYCTEFDGLVSNLGFRYSEQISSAREILAGALTAEITDSLLEHIRLAIVQFKETLPTTSTHQSNHLLLTEQFKHIWNLLTGFQSTHPEAINTQLLSKLVQLSGLVTKDLAEVITPHNELEVSPRHVGPQIETVLHEAVLKTELGQARSELQELLTILVMYGSHWTQISQRENTVTAAVTKFVTNAKVLPETNASHLELYSQSPIASAFAASSWFLLLYVPDTPKDPAIAQHVWYEHHLRMKEVLERDSSVWEEIKTVFGCTSASVEEWFAKLQEQYKSETVPDIWRPEQKDNALPISLVHNDLVSLRNLAFELTESPRKTLDEISLAESIVEKLVNRLSQSTQYRDLIVPAVCASKLLSLGLSLQWHNLNEEIAMESFTNIWLLDPISVSLNPQALMEYPLLALSAMTCCRTVPLDQLQELLGGIHRKWTLDRLRIEEEQKDALLGYKYTDDLDSEEAVEQEFKKMFPSFDEEGYSVAENKESDFSERLCDLYIALFLDSVKGDVADTIKNAVTSLKSVIGKSDCRHLPAFYLVLNERCSKTELSSSEINFYTDSSMPETVASVEFAEKVLNGISEFLVQWPEHDTLLTLQRTSNEILALPPGVPVALRLSKVEQTHHYLYEWDRFATKANKVGELMADASSLIVRWRKLELATWPSLFVSEQKRAKSSTAALWFHLFETLIISPVHDFIETVKVLVVFLAESTVGQFETRLSLLHAFEMHLRLLNNVDAAVCVMNIRKFYAQYLPQIKEGLAVSENMLKREVNDVIKLASWRDINIHALKQSALRSHRKLFKVVKRYRQVLESAAIPDLCVLQQSNLMAGPVAFGNVSSFAPGSVDIPEMLLASKYWANRPKHLKDLSTVCTNLTVYAEKIQAINSNLDTFASDIVERATELRKQTPTTWNKETKATIKSLKMEKQQFLTTVLKELRSAGLRSAIKKSTIENQCSLVNVLASNYSFSSASIFNGCDPAFFAMIELLPRLRATVSESLTSDIDVSSSDIQRGMGFAENLFARVLKLRQAAAVHESTACPAEIVSLLKGMESRPVKMVYDAVDAKSVVLDAVHVSNAVASVFNSVSANSSANFTSFIGKLQADSNTLLVGSQEIETCFAELETLISSNASTSQFGKTDSSALISPLLAALSTQLASLRKKLIRIPGAEPFDSVTAKINEFSSLVLVVTQKITAVTSKYSSEVSEDEENELEWLKHSLKYAEKLLSCLHSEKIWSLLADIGRNVLSLSNSCELELVSGLCKVLLVFVQGYELLTSRAETVFANALLTTETGAIKLMNLLFSLAKTGFCSPDPVDDDDEKEDKGDKTGLGDGSGDNGTSKDIDEDDDDVSEAMQTSNPDQEERDEAEEDKAQEVEKDIAGEVEDLDPKDGEDEDQDDENDSDEDAEDEVNNDDLDPEAVDEKMWDGPTNDDEKEKESKNETAGGDKDDLEANEQDQEDKKDDKKENDRDTNDGDEGNDEGSEEEDLDQDEDVQQGENPELQPEVEQKDALDLPEDMQLDEPEGDDEGDEMDEMNDDEMDDDEMDADEMDVDEMDAETVDNMDAETETGEADEDKMEEGEDEGKDEGKDEDKMDEGEEEEQGAEPEPEPEPETDGGNIEDVPEQGDSAMGENEQNADSQSIPAPENKSIAEKDATTNSNDPNEQSGQGDARDSVAEEEEMGTGGSTTTGNPPPPVTNDQPNAEEKKTMESLKQLGDALKEYHTRQKEIKEASKDLEDESAEKADDSESRDPLNGDEEFEHVGADDAHDTQALGSCSKDVEQQELNEEMAIDDEQEPNADQEVAGEEDGAGAGIDAERNAAPGESDNEEVENNGETAYPETGSADFDGDMSDDSDVQDETVKTSAVKTVSQETDLWRQYENKVHDLAMALGEQLRLIMEPTLASKLRGDYKTGKRLNMRRIIPYIASDFRKDKIWLRRTKPAKREYQVLLALDDSKSMGEPAVVDLAFQAIALVGNALNTVEAGEIAIARFGESTEIIHPLQTSFNVEAGNEVLRHFTFSQNKTNVNQLLTDSLAMFAESSGPNEQWKLEIIISDGIADDRDQLKKLVRKANDEHVMLVFVVLDALNKDTSILDMNEVKYVTDSSGAMKLEVSRYMDEFPFEYYVLVRNIRDLPSVLATVLRQYFQAVDQ